MLYYSIGTLYQTQKINITYQVIRILFLDKNHGKD